MGSFSLKVESSYRFDLKPIQQEGAGMYSKTVRSAWCVHHPRMHFSILIDHLGMRKQQQGDPVSNATR